MEEANSSSSDNDSLYEVFKKSSSYQANDWKDDSVSLPFHAVREELKLCHACCQFFENDRLSGISYSHHRFLESLKSAARRGCRLCILFLDKIDRRTTYHYPCEDIALELTAYSFAEEQWRGVDIFFMFKRAPRRSKYGDWTYGIKRLVLIPLEKHTHVPRLLDFAPNTSSSQSRAIARRWVDCCTTKHITCTHAESHPSWMPTRLLDIQSYRSQENGNGIVQLVESKDMDHNQDYASLSHCWGQTKPFSLTQANIQLLKREIRVDGLPKTFQHAISVASDWFQIQFLWIDSLCIIQDSEQDWLNECGRMRQVYQNATINISAANALNSSFGLFFDRCPATVPIFPIHASWEGDLEKGSFSCFPYNLWDHGVGRAPLNKRAWVVQERFLSKRNLHFGAQMMYFECQELDACETFPEGLPSYFNSRTHSRFKRMPTSVHSTLSNGTGHCGHGWLNDWLKIARAYMGSGITYASDKIIAISSVAEEFQARTDADYLTGLWRPHLAEQLLWRVRGCKRIDGQPSSRPREYRAPTWSWLSIDANVNMANIQYQPTLIEFVDAKVHLTFDEWRTGPVRGGSLVIRGNIQAASLQCSSDDPDRYYILGQEGNRLGYVQVWFDVPTDMGQELREVFYTLVRVAAPNPRLEGLLLAPTTENQSEYCRIGTFREDDSSTYGEMLKTVIKEDKLFSFV